MSKKKKTKAKDNESATRTKDRPPGPHDRVLDNGLVYGRWYGGAPQDCPNSCRGVPEGIHVPPCPLNTSNRAEPEEMPAETSPEAVTSDE